MSRRHRSRVVEEYYNEADEEIGRGSSGDEYGGDDGASRGEERFVQVGHGIDKQLWLPQEVMYAIVSSCNPKSMRHVTMYHTPMRHSLIAGAIYPTLCLVVPQCFLFLTRFLCY
jgi:hypothetical protein